MFRSMSHVKTHYQRQNAFRMRKKAVQQGHSKVREATNRSLTFADGRELVSAPYLRARRILFHPARPKLLWQLLPDGTLSL
jgi:hypothetical protein